VEQARQFEGPEAETKDSSELAAQESSPGGERSLSPAPQSEVEALRAELRAARRSLSLGLALVFLVQGAWMAIFIAGKLTTPVTETLAARRILVLDGEGKVRMSLGTRESGAPALSLMSPEGEIRVAVLLDDESRPSIGLTTRKGGLQSLISVTEAGSRIALFDEQGQSRVNLTASSEENDKGAFPGLYLNDRSGMNRARLFVAGQGEESYAVFGLNDAKGRSRAAMTLDKDGRPILRFYNDGGEAYASLHIEEGGARPQVYLTGRDGEILWEAR
jgi:hypothetical protein